MAHLQTDGAQVFSLWNNEGMASRPKLPRNFSQAAKLVIDIATGQAEDRESTPEEQGKGPAAVALARRGRLTTEQRYAAQEAARKAAKARWSNYMTSL
jgi:hypothetical protein